VDDVTRESSPPLNVGRDQNLEFERMMHAIRVCLAPDAIAVLYAPPLNLVGQLPEVFVSPTHLQERAQKSFRHRLLWGSHAGEGTDSEDAEGLGDSDPDANGGR
jgi:hypothetical protein